MVRCNSQSSVEIMINTIKIWCKMCCSAASPLLHTLTPHLIPLSSTLSLHPHYHRSTPSPQRKTHKLSLCGLCDPSALDPTVGCTQSVGKHVLLRHGIQLYYLTGTGTFPAHNYTIMHAYCHISYKLYIGVGTAGTYPCNHKGLPGLLIKYVYMCSFITLLGDGLVTELAMSS